MANELQTLNERIAERIGNDLVDLIPPDQWQQMVDNEVEKFKQDKLPKLIEQLLTDIYKIKIKNSLEELTNCNVWDVSTQSYINNELKAFIGDSAGVIVAGMLSPSMQIVLQDLRSRLY
jgi:uncharacterized membrane protein YheB (UPF0754 family)